MTESLWMGVQQQEENFLAGRWSSRTSPSAGSWQDCGTSHTGSVFAPEELDPRGLQR
jgi:hypothetical protein